MTTETTTDFCWLVELFEGDGSGNSTGLYHTGFTNLQRHSRITKDPHKARRYDRAAAEQVAELLGTTLTGTWKAVEHGFERQLSADDIETLRAQVAQYEDAIKQAGAVIDPFKPAGQPGSYARGYYNGTVQTLQAIRAAIDKARKV